MKLIDIQTLNYYGFKNQIKHIENLLNKNFRDREIELHQLYWELNFIIFGRDIDTYNDDLDIFIDDGICIGNNFQKFYIEGDYPCFAIDIMYLIKTKTVSNIKIRLLQ